MSSIIVLGGGIVGLSTGMLLARQGHDVTVFERDATPLPESPEAAWERRGVAQFRQPHYMHAAGHRVLADHLPEVNQALLQAGGVHFDLATFMPRSLRAEAERHSERRRKAPADRAWRFRRRAVDRPIDRERHPARDGRSYDRRRRSGRRPGHRRNGSSFEPAGLVGSGLERHLCRAPDGRHHRPLPSDRRRWVAGCDRRPRRGRRVGVHEPGRRHAASPRSGQRSTVGQRRHRPARVTRSRSP